MPTNKTFRPGAIRSGTVLPRAASNSRRVGRQGTVESRRPFRCTGPAMSLRSLSVIFVLGAALLALTLWSGCNTQKQQADEMAKLLGQLTPVAQAAQELQTALSRGIKQAE